MIRKMKGNTKKGIWYKYKEGETEIGNKIQENIKRSNQIQEKKKKNRD